MKRCSNCLLTKSLDAFHKRSANKADGRQHTCKACQKQATYAYRAANPDAIKATRRRAYARGGRDRQYQRLYGISEADVEALRVVQRGLCDLCGRPEAEARGGRLCVDHDHASGAVRALLCHDCNTALGKFQDDPALLRAAALYVESHAYGAP